MKFGDGTEEEIDTIIYCTGYKYWFPFLDPEDHIIEFEQNADWVIFAYYVLITLSLGQRCHSFRILLWSII